MIFKKVTLLALLVVSLVSCAFEVDNAPVRPVEQVEVGFEIPIDATRTSLDPDGRTTRWAEGDKLAVWAKDADGGYAFENASFMLRYFSPEYDKAFFASNIAAMAEGEYTYYLSYPTPVSTNGTLATYTLPAVQTGEYDGRYDVMIAEPVVEGALTTSKRVELNTIMRHQMHGIKITVPEGRNLYGDRFYRLEITFPNAVVGDIVVDVTNPDAEPTYSNTSNVVVLESAEGFDAGSEIWAFVLPGTIDGDVSYFVRGEYRKSNDAVYHLTRTMERGHITPINMAIPEIYPYYTAVTFSIDQNNLGEEFNFFDVYDANGNHMGQFARNAKNKYVVDYEGEFDADQYDNTSWRVVFDSEHAIVETTVNLGDMTDYTQHTRWMNVPYLFAEDFANLATFAASYKDGPHTSVSAASSTAVDISQYGIGTGWTGARVGCDAAGTSILVSGRTDYVIAGATRAYGRLDSPALSCIKADKYVKVKVSFDYGGSRSGGSWAYAVGRVGYTTTQGPINGYATQFNNDPAFSNIDGAVEVPNIPKSGSASSLPLSMEMIIDDCSSDHRISWHIGSMGTTFIGNGYQWMYVDNVRVQIVK